MIRIIAILHLVWMVNANIIQMILNVDLLNVMNRWRIVLKLVIVLIVDQDVLIIQHVINMKLRKHVDMVVVMDIVSGIQIMEKENVKL